MEAGRELDALVAENVMGWTLKGAISITWDEISEYSKRAVANTSDEIGSPVWDNNRRVDAWCPSTNITATWEMEEMIEQRGLNLLYAQALMAVLLFEGFVPEDDEALWWALIHASPYQRCCAALKAVEKA